MFRNARKPMTQKTDALKNQYCGCASNLLNKISVMHNANGITASRNVGIQQRLATPMLYSAHTSTKKANVATKNSHSLATKCDGMLAPKKPVATPCTMLSSVKYDDSWRRMSRA